MRLVLVACLVLIAVVSAAPAGHGIGTWNCRGDQDGEEDQDQGRGREDQDGNEDDEHRGHGYQDNGDHHGGHQWMTNITDHVNRTVLMLRAIQSTSTKCDQTGDVRAWNLVPKNIRQKALTKIGTSADAAGTLAWNTLSSATQQLLADKLAKLISKIPESKANLKEVKSILLSSTDVIRVDFCFNEQSLDKYVNNKLNEFIEKILNEDEQALEKAQASFEHMGHFAHGHGHGHGHGHRHEQDDD
jgi:hypothetical protein